MKEAEPDDRLAQLIASVRSFAVERDWQQFHNAKNLTMALAGEAGELLAELQWVEPDALEQVLAAGTPTRAAFQDEMADVFIYLLRLADVTNVDLIDAARSKLQENRKRYDVGTSRGSSKKQRRPSSR